MRKKLIVVSLSSLLGLAVVASGGGFWYVKHAVAVTSGEIRTGVQKQVAVTRDAYGVPHIEAQSEQDLMYAQGYVQAQDRMWQMEMSRLAVSGRLTEAIGRSMLDRDKMFRTIGLKRIADEEVPKLPAATREALQAFADGVNAYLADHAGNLPVEYGILGYKPEQWTIADSLAIGKYMAYDLGGNMRTELFYMTALKKFGPEKALSLLPGLRESDKQKAFPPELTQAVGSTEETDQLLNLLAETSNGTVPGDGKGSNNWVIAGSRSESGKPLLANDMHLGIGEPSVFFQNHLSVPGLYSVTGVIFPGVPGVVVGHNDKIAWGFTNLMPDVQDLYVEKPNPANSHQFEYNGTYEDAQVIPETYKIKGEDKPVTGETVITRHGPIITGTFEYPTGSQPLALRWTALEYTDEITAMLMMDKATGWSQFEEGLKHFNAPPQNVVYADTDGNIAYRAVGNVPIRKNGIGIYPVPGWTDKYEWQGYIPFDQMPHQWNPSQGYIATANNKIADDAYPYPISLEYDVPYRIQRINQMIQAKDKLKLSDLQKMQNDFYNLEAEKFVPQWLQVLKSETLTDSEKKVRDLLEAWAKNPVDDKDLVGPTIYHTVMTRLLNNTLKPQMDEDTFMNSFKAGVGFRAVDAILQEDNQAWFKGTDQTKEKVIAKSFKEAVADLTDRIGKNPDKWTWGTLHTVTFAHPLGSVPGLNLLFNSGPHPFGGSNVTVGSGGYTRSQPYQVNLAAPWRFTVDMSNPAKAQDVMEMGESGQLGSSHYNDQTQMWLTGQYKDMYFAPDDVKTHAEETQMLDPK